MSQYQDLITEVEGLFALTEWTSLNIPAYPTNFLDSSRAGEFVVIEVLPSKPLMIEYGENSQVGGLIIIQIYIPVNTGSRRLYEISDLLDQMMQKKVLSFNIQTENSSLDVKGVDSTDSNLFRGDYTVRFNSY